MSLPSRKLTIRDAGLVLALDQRGWAQHDIAALLGCNMGRVNEICLGRRHRDASPADLTAPEARTTILALVDDLQHRLREQIELTLRGEEL